MKTVIRIWVKQSRKAWYCIPKKFSDCPSGEYSFSGSASLDRVSKSEWIKTGKCKEKVKIRNTNSGYERNTWPITLTTNDNKDATL